MPAQNPVQEDQSMVDADEVSGSQNGEANEQEGFIQEKQRLHVVRIIPILCKNRIGLTGWT
jgi:hypothetical protein